MALGCGTYEAFLMKRGGKLMVKQLKFSALDWNRNIDDVSLASITLAGIQGGKGTWCCDDAHLITPWEHELGIYRNGLRVWAGPVIGRNHTKTGVTVSARDIMVWMKRRRIRRNHDAKNQDLAVVFHDVVKDALIPDNSMGLVVSPTLCGVNGDRRYLAAQYKVAWPVLDELSRTGVDWTVVDRAVTVGNFELDLTPIATLTDGSFLEYDEFNVSGEDLVTDATVLGDGFGEAGATIVGRYVGGDMVRYGVHELVYQESEIRDLRSAQRNARTRWDLNHEPAKFFTGGVLSQEAGVDVSELIAGRAVRLALGEDFCDTVTGTMRLASVNGSVGPEHDRISIRVQPLGTSGLAA